MNVAMTGFTEGLPASVPPLQAAGIDGILILLAIAIGSAVMEWLKKRKEAGQSESPTEGLETPPASRRGATPPAPPLARPRPAAASNWEEELRRLLSGEPTVTEPPPAAREAPRAPVRTPADRTSGGLPPPVITGAPSPRRGPTPVEPMIRQAEAAQERRYALQEAAAKTRQRAAELQERVAERKKPLEGVTSRRLITVPSVQRRALSPTAARALAMFRDPSSARQAMIAKFVLGRPKALDAE